MIPRVGKLTATSRKLFNSLLHSAQKQMIAIESSGGHFLSDQFFEANLIDVIRPLGKDRHSVDMMKKHIREMNDVRVEWTSPDANARVIWNTMVLISQAKLIIEAGRVRVLWAFPPDIVSALTGPNPYTIIRIEEMARLKTYAAVALYEICSRYRDNPSGVTSRNTPEWWVEALTNDSHRRSTKDTSTVVLRPWRMFKLEKIKPAIEEINTNTGLRISLMEDKCGSSTVKEVQFCVTKASNPLELQDPSAQTSLTRCHVEAEQLQIAAKHVTSSLSAGYSELQISIALAKCSARLRREDLDPITNIVSYFKRTLKGDEVGAATSGGPSDVVPKLVPNFTMQSPAAVSVAPGEPQAVATSTPVPSVTAIVTRELMDLNHDEQSRYVSMARDSLKQRGFLNPGLIRRFDNGQWQSGIILAEVVRFYALDRYGPNWNSPIQGP